MNPKKKLIEKAVRNGTLERVKRLLSAAQILNCEANTLIEESSDLMLANGLCLGMIKKLHCDFVKSADRYFSEFSKLVKDDKSVIEMFGEVDKFDTYFREWAKIPPKWQIEEDPE